MHNYIHGHCRINVKMIRVAGVCALALKSLQNANNSVVVIDEGRQGIVHSRSAGCR